MIAGGNITSKKISGSLKKKSKSRDYQARDLSKGLVKVAKGKKSEKKLMVF